MSSYPTSIFNPRERENRSGVSYDETKKSVIFAEDLNNSDDEIVAIETELGESPKGIFESVAANLTALWEAIAGFVSSFLELSDTPASYEDQAGKVVAVNAEEDGLEFVPSGGGAWTVLSDVILDTDSNTIEATDIPEFEFYKILFSTPGVSLPCEILLTLNNLDTNIYGFDALYGSTVTQSSNGSSISLSARRDVPANLSSFFNGDISSLSGCSKIINWLGSFASASATINYNVSGGGIVNLTDPITSIKLKAESQNFLAGARLIILGLNL